MQLALFDFDNTLTTCDTYSRFLRLIASPTQLTRARWTIGPWLLGYRAGLISATAIRCRATRVALAGRAVAEITTQARHYAEQQLPTMLDPAMMQRLQWHRQQGHTVALVSASIDLYLRPWCRQYGLDLICNRLEQHGDHFTGRYFDDCGPHKAERIRERYRLERFSRVYAYGDSVEDRPMLALAQERWYRGVREA